MRNLTLTIMLFALATSAAAQEHTLFDGAGAKGEFGGPVIKFTTLRNQNAMLIGGRGGWIIDHSFVIGGGGYGVVTEVDGPAGALSHEGALDIKFGYLGLELEYIVEPKSLGHYSFYTLIGAGTTHYVKDVGRFERSTQQTGETSYMFVLEPGVNAELNILNNIRMNAGVSYRLVSGVYQPGLSNSDFSGLSATFTLKIGSF